MCAVIYILSTFLQLKMMRKERYICQIIIPKKSRSKNLFSPPTYYSNWYTDAFFAHSVTIILYYCYLKLLRRRTTQKIKKTWWDL